MSDQANEATQTPPEAAPEATPVAVTPPPTEFRILAAGINTSTKGPVIFDSAASQAVMQAYTIHGQARLPLAYQHGDTDKTSPDSGKAAGFFTPEVRNGELWATQIQWTEDATTALSKHEWAYFSPTLIQDGEGRVLELISVSLTNIPSLDGLSMLIPYDRNPKTEITMAELSRQVAETKALWDSIKVELDRTKQERDNARVELDRLKAEKTDAEIAAEVNAAMTAGKATPAMADALVKIGKLDRATLTALITAMPIQSFARATKLNPAPVAPAGKSWEQMSNTEKAALHASDPALFNQLRSEFNKRKDGR